MIFEFISLSITFIANVLCQIIQIPVARDNVIKVTYFTMSGFL
jgi:hypothetical protein